MVIDQYFFKNKTGSRTKHWPHTFISILLTYFFSDFGNLEFPPVFSGVKGDDEVSYGHWSVFF
jgi:hypothetical protein